MKRKKVCNMIMATALSCSLISMPVFAEPAVDSSASLESQKEAAQGEASNLQAQLTSLLGKMTDIQNQLITKGQEIQKASEELKVAQEDEKQRFEDMKLRIKYMYEEGDSSAMERLLTSGSIGEMLAQAEYIQNVHSYDREKLEQYVETKNQVAELKSSLETEAKNIEKMQSEFEKQQTELTATLNDKTAQVANLDQQIQAAAAKAAEEAAKKKADEEAKEASASTNSPAGAETAVTPATPESTPEYTPNGGNNTGGGGGAFTPPYNASAADIIVAAAMSQVGNAMYQWGAQKPYVAFDCSGLTQWCYAQAGISIGRVDTSQLYGGTIVSDPMPGDIAWTPGHVAIYIGGGQMVEAQQDGVPICISPVRATYYVRY